MRFSFRDTALEGAILVEATAHEDVRGDLTEWYVRSEYARAGIDVSFVQHNVTRSRRGVLRGLHYQIPPYAQAKLVGVVAGEIYDVGVDLRRGSPTFGVFIAERLSERNRRLLFLPEGIAHGYAVLSGEATVAYMASAEYSPAHDRGIRWDEPTLAIPWPISAPDLSVRDRHLPGLGEAELP